MTMLSIDTSKKIDMLTRRQIFGEGEMNILERREWPMKRCHDPAELGAERATPLAEVRRFVSGLVAHSLTQPGLPLRRELAVLFVDIADSTRTSGLPEQDPESRPVTEVSLMCNNEEE